MGNFTVTLSYIICGDKLLLYVNLTKNDTKTRDSTFELKEKYNSLKLFSFVVSVASIVSLVLLLLTYVLLVELRNLPGKSY